MELAIIGAGMAGLAAAHRLRTIRPDLNATIYEKSHGVGGRVATRRRDGCLFDHGAQLFKTPTPELLQIVREELPAEGLRDIGRPVWVFDREGTIAEGDPELNREPKWTYAAGISQLGKLLAADLEVRTQLRVGRLTQRAGGGFRLFDVDRQGVGEADLVLLTPPAPQSAEILAASTIEAAPRDALIAELGRASYRRCLSLTLAYDRPLERPFYSLVNIDRAHPIAWLAIENAKGPERCPRGQTLLTAQMAHGWSLERWDSPLEQVEREIAELVGALLGEDLRRPLWSDRQGWRYALPDSGADFDLLNSTSSGIYCAGDFSGGIGRVHVAIEQGWRVAELLRRWGDEVMG